ncbi:MAG: hypothetical protein J6Q67_03930 [Clostridia bacterium]|nr:hypothetical protein [Clostridia bacterium]
MSIKLAKDEKIVRTYDYATSSTKGLASSASSKTLVITNKRIVHREAGHGSSNEFLNTSEMPLEAAKYVNTFYTKIGFPALLVFGIIFAIIALAGVIALPEDIKMLAVPFFFVAALFIVLFFVKKKLSFTCTIDTDTHITPAFSFSSTSGNSATNGVYSKLAKANKVKSIQINVDYHVAKQMADELGYVIMAAKNGDFDSVEAPVAVAKAEEVKVEEVKAEEVTEEIVTESAE